MASKPTIVLIPGACTEPSCFDGLRSCLRDAGYESVAVSHPSANPTDPFAHTAETMGLNVQENYIQPLLDAGKEILVFGYSSGGSETGTSGPSWVLSDREARGHKGGVIGIVYLSSALPPAGVPQLAVMGGVWPPMVKPDTPKLGLFAFDPIIPYLFNDAGPSEQEALAKTALPHAMGVITTPVLPPLWAEKALVGRRIWIKAMQDAIFGPEIAQAIIDGSGVDWDVVERDIGHCGSTTQPEVVSRVLVDAAKKWSV